MIAMASLDILILTLKICSKFCSCLNPLSIKQIKKYIFDALLEIKSIEKIETLITQMLLSWNIFLDHSFGILKYFFGKINFSFKFYMTWVIFWYKIWNEKFP